MEECERDVRVGKLNRKAVYDWPIARVVRRKERRTRGSARACEMSVYRRVLGSRFPVPSRNITMCTHDFFLVLSCYSHSVPACASTGSRISHRCTDKEVDLGKFEHQINYSLSGISNHIAQSNNILVNQFAEKLRSDGTKGE